LPPARACRYTLLPILKRFRPTRESAYTCPGAVRDRVRYRRRRRHRIGDDDPTVSPGSSASLLPDASLCNAPGAIHCSAAPATLDAIAISVYYHRRRTRLRLWLPTVCVYGLHPDIVMRARHRGDKTYVEAASVAVSTIAVNTRRQRRERSMQPHFDLRSPPQYCRTTRLPPYIDFIDLLVPRRGSSERYDRYRVQAAWVNSISAPNAARCIGRVGLRYPLSYRHNHPGKVFSP